jgi:predicted nucleic acid-binding protein
MSAVVVDASFAVKWVLQERYTTEARALLIDWEERGIERLTVTLFLSEVNTALLRRLRDEIITLRQAEAARQDLLAAVTVRIEDVALAGRALVIADGLGLRNAYDCAYAALAEREGCEFWTGDERFWNLARGRYPWVRWVGEVSQV